MRVRPTRRSRPRTRIRPQHRDAVDGFVIAVDRGRYTCRTTGGNITAMRARELGRKSVVVGDRVRLVGDTSGHPGTLARIVGITERYGQLRRTADDDDTTERIIVANVDQLVVVASLADPPPRTGFIDRCLVAAFDADIKPLLCLTKADLDHGELSQIRDYYGDLDVDIVTCRPQEEVAVLRARLADKLSVLIGHSGVGKSTLVNRLVPSADRVVGEVSDIGKGRHTSTSAVALELPDGGWIVDTPGVRSFGLAHVSPDSLLRAFGDLAEVSCDCPRGCDHTGVHGDCALDGLRDTAGSPPQRLVSFRRLLDSLTGPSH